MRSNLNKKIIFTGGLFIIAILIFSFSVFASTTDGTIDSMYKYAWGENIGWINFGCDNCNVHITDSGLTGYAWSENYGWINLNPSTSGIKNDGNGNLSGYAWAEGLGWIDFSGVTINSNGEFLGYAVILKDNSKISLNCINTNSCNTSDFKIKTDWRPKNTRSVPSLIAGTSAQTQVSNLISMGNYQYAYQVMKEFPHLFTQKDWDLINEKLGKTNQTTTTTIPTKLSEIAKYQFNNNLQIGMQGHSVIELQKRLKEEGLYNGPITGYFGPLTEAAVKSYQKKYGIKPTGIVGPITRDRLNSSQNQTSSTITNIKNQSENQKTQCPYFTKSLRLGMNDEEVEKVQQFLINQGFLSQDFKKSSLFDKATEDAVKKFQTKYHNEILKPWGLSSPTGYWYTTTKKQANKLIGCE